MGNIKKSLDVCITTQNPMRSYYGYHHPLLEAGTIRQGGDLPKVTWSYGQEAADQGGDPGGLTGIWAHALLPAQEAGR